jgi:hypothetical protein
VALGVGRWGGTGRARGLRLLIRWDDSGFRRGGLRGAEQRQPVIALEEVDHERRRHTALCSPAAWWMDGAKASPFVARQRFRRCGAAKSGVWTVEGLVTQGAIDVGFTLGIGAEWNGGPEIEQAMLERSPEAFQLGVGAVMVGRAEAQADAASLDVLAEGERAEVSGLVHDQVSRRAVPAEGGLDECDHVGGAGLGIEESCAERNASEAVEYEGKLARGRWVRAADDESEEADCG